jgi:hypothetical protein
MRCYFRFLLMLFLCGCATVSENKTTAAADTAPIALLLNFTSGEELVDTVERLMEEQQEGRKTLVKFQVQTTVGWGCPCPDFVHAKHEFEDLDVENSPEAFLDFQIAEGVPNINDFIVAMLPKGRFHVTGHYTGEFSDWQPRQRDARKSRTGKPARGVRPKACNFKLLIWCYEPPAKPEDGMSKSSLEELREKGVPWCGTPPPVCDPKIACVGTCPFSDKPDGCGGLCGSHNFECGPGQKCNEDEGICVSAPAP